MNCHTSAIRRYCSFLNKYYTEVKSNPTFEEIKDLAKFLGEKKENVYWWFVRRNKKDQHMTTVSNDIGTISIKPKCSKNTKERKVQKDNKIKDPASNN